MYEIDLLKGEGVPIRSRPGGIAFACLVIAVPLIVGAAMASIYMEHRVATSVQSQQLIRLRRMIAALSPALETKRTLENRQAANRHLLGDIRTALSGYTQWSPVLTTVIDCMPDALILTKIEATRHSVRREVPLPDNPKATTEIVVPVRALQIGVCGYDEQSAYRAVRTFQDRLRATPVLGPRIDTVTVSQQSQVLNGKQVVSYELNCAFQSPSESTK